MLYSADFRRKAREALSGRWGTAVGAGFVAGILGANVDYGNIIEYTLNDEDKLLSRIRCKSGNCRFKKDDERKQVEIVLPAF